MLVGWCCGNGWKEGTCHLLQHTGARDDSGKLKRLRQLADVANSARDGSLAYFRHSDGGAASGLTLK